jgi:regulator of protease activity HflC (stomatin/prohibitin superfamily)
MEILIAAAVIVLLLASLARAVRIVKQYEQGALFRLGEVLGARGPMLGAVAWDGRARRRWS